LLGLAITAIGVPLLMLSLIRKLDGSVLWHVPSPGFTGWLREVKLWHVAAAIGLTALVFAALTNGESGPFLFLLFFVGLVLITRVWKHEFLFLMSLCDDELPGRHDKLL
jgi:hypothetical protein